MGDATEVYTDEARRAAGEAWLSASQFALDHGEGASDPDGLRSRVAGPMPLSTFRIWRKAICCWRPIMPRMKAALPLPRR
jgi:hypothetical protein